MPTLPTPAACGPSTCPARSARASTGTACALLAVGGQAGAFTQLRLVELAGPCRGRRPCVRALTARVAECRPGLPGWPPTPAAPPPSSFEAYEAVRDCPMPSFVVRSCATSGSVVGALQTADRCAGPL
ncbi:hypothetical protein ABR737_00140 [Streptomyces sp. Edi2]|uniref:hypothetical protein n=1 Tax=Streptomyces sp. Edi2 TaxID=3162528 RepID=UPI003305DBBF